jgi:hypothetical protein
MYVIVEVGRGKMPPIKDIYESEIVTRHGMTLVKASKGGEQTEIVKAVDYTILMLSSSQTF